MGFFKKQLRRMRKNFKERWNGLSSKEYEVIKFSGEKKFSSTNWLGTRLVTYIVAGMILIPTIFQPKQSYYESPISNPPEEQVQIVDQHVPSKSIINFVKQENPPIQNIKTITPARNSNKQREQIIRADLLNEVGTTYEGTNILKCIDKKVIAPGPEYSIISFQDKKRKEYFADQNGIINIPEGLTKVRFAKINASDPKNPDPREAYDASFATTIEYETSSPQIVISQNTKNAQTRANSSLEKICEKENKKTIQEAILYDGTKSFDEKVMEMKLNLSKGYVSNKTIADTLGVGTKKISQSLERSDWVYYAKANKDKSKYKNAIKYGRDSLRIHT